MGFPSCRTEQLLQGKRLKEKEDKEEKHIRKLFRKNAKKNVFHYPKLKVIYILGLRKSLEFWLCGERFPKYKTI